MSDVNEPWLPGKTIGGYVLVEPMAAGAMGEVWLAVREGAQGFRVPVAIKRLHAALLREPDMVRMFLDEARLLSTLSHDGVVRVLDAAESPAGVYAVLEYVDGETLSSLFRKAAGPMSAPVAVGIARALAEALHYVHTRPEGIVHRDVSPRNVLVTRAGGVKLLDFGIARSALRRTQTEAGQLRGTLAYMAPEQARGEAVDARADQFALSVLLFELLTGTRLYGERSEVELLGLVAARDGAAADVRARGVEIPEAIAAVVERGLSRDPAARYPTLREFIDALSSWEAPRAIERFMADVAPAGPRRWENVSASHLPRVGVRKWPFVVVLVAAVVAGAVFFQPPPVVQIATPPASPPAPVVIEVPPPAEVVDAGVAVKAVKPRAARLTLKTIPWTHVYLGKKLLGETPLVGVSLPSGTHQLRLLNRESNVATTIEVQLAPGEAKTLSLNLQ